MKKNAAEELQHQAELFYAELVNSIEAELIATTAGLSERQERFVLRRHRELVDFYLDIKNLFMGNSYGRIYFHERKKIIEGRLRDIGDGQEEDTFYYDGVIVAAGGLETPYVIATEADAVGTPLAVKILYKSVDEATQEMFAREQFVLRTLAKHYQDRPYPPNLLRYYALGKGVTVTERVVGARGLDKTLIDDQYTLEARLNWLQDIASGLSALYTSPVRATRHGDISPNNCVLGADGVVRVCDYSCVGEDTQPNFVGKPPYIAPENVFSYVLIGTKPRKLEQPMADNRSDVFSLAIMAYEFLTAGKYPMHTTVPEGADVKVDGWRFLVLHAAALQEYTYDAFYRTSELYEVPREEIAHFAKKYTYRSLQLWGCPFISDSAVLEKVDACIQKAMSFDYRLRHATPQEFVTDLRESIGDMSAV